MFVIIKREKSDHLKHKVRELKELACDVLDCLDEAYKDSRYSETRERSRGDERDDYRRREDDDDYDDDYRETARGRGRERRGRGRY